jgi:hypothetical protein
MYRNTTVGSLPLGLSRRFLGKCSSTLCVGLVALCATALFGSLSLQAQLTNGGIQGRVTDKSGAVVPKAEVTATNTDTGVQTAVQSNGTGDYSIQPLQPGNYNVEVVAKGFVRLLQENVDVDATSIQRYDPKLSAGAEGTTITVTEAPPFLNTTDATLGGTIENELYSQLPLSMNGGPRDPTAFQYLMPGVQENPNNNSGTGGANGNSGSYGGSGETNLNENYVDGVPVPTINQGGNSSPVSTAVSVDAVDQFSVQTNGASAGFGGAGSTNYTIKSGGNQFHGTVFDYTRNTLFDTWGYLGKLPSATGFATKPGEHQDSYGGSVGGPILKDKLFFFVSYEGYHYTKITNTPAFLQVPTLAERTGNFTDVLGFLSAGIQDPTASTTRSSFTGLLNGVPTFNVIPQSEISPTSWYLQNGCLPVGCAAVPGSLPVPTSVATTANYLAGLPLANEDYSTDLRMDYTLNSRNKFSVDALGGNFGYNNQPNYSTPNQLPPPYAAGTYQDQKTATGILTYNFIVSQTMVNSAHYGYTRTWGQQYSITQGKNFPGTTNGENSLAAGINNLPLTGNSPSSMPNITGWGNASGQGSLANWPSNSNSGPLATNSYTIVDQLVWNKGRHNITFGAQVEWLESNGGSFGGYSKTLNLSFSNGSTTGGNGSAYASFLIGAVNSGSTTEQTIQDVGGRYRPISPYITDTWRATPKLTLTLGIRYDSLQPYHEAQDRISFLNVNTINPIVQYPGVVEYAGFAGKGFYSMLPANSPYNPYICSCTTPVHPYNKNFGPRLGFAYAANPTTVISGGFSIQYTHAGATGGGSNSTGSGSSATSQAGAGASTAATGNSGMFQLTTSWNSPGNSVPAFFLNSTITSVATNAGFDPPVQGSQPTGITGTNIPCVAAATCSPYSAIPPWTPPGISVNPLQSTGDYNYQSFNADHQNDFACSTSDNATCNGGGVNFADPYYGARGPQFVNYNFGIQKQINKKAVLSINYAGSQTHFLPGGSGRGPATNSYSPDYNVLLNSILARAAGSFFNTVKALIPSYKLPYPTFAGPNALVGASLAPFPQFGGGDGGNMTDLWGDTGNSSSNALQMLLIQRPWHNLSGFVDYTRSKELDDVGNHRVQYPVGPQDGNFTRNYTANQIDRGPGNISQTNAFNATWVYGFPFGRGQAFFASNRIIGAILGGWTVHGIYEYRDGYPIQVTQTGGVGSSGCNPVNNGGGAGHGTCMPDYVPGFNKSQVRVNGRWGHAPGTTAANFGNTSYINPNAFECPDSPANGTGLQEGGITNGTQQGIYTTCGSSNNTGGQLTWKIGNLARSAPYDLHGPGWWRIDMGVRRTFNVRETATLHLTFEVDADTFNLTNSTFFNLGSSSWNSGASFGALSGQNQSVPPRDWQFAGRFRF